MTTGQEISLWSIRLAVALWFVFALTLRGHPTPVQWRRSRIWWTMATIVYLVHVGFAFAAWHQWSHDLATRHTAEVTARVTGLAWGGGIWFNHLFTLVCVAETVLWWLRPGWIRNRPAWVAVVLYGFCLFIVVNATVVFASGWIRWIGLGMLAWLTIHLYLKRRRPVPAVAPGSSD